MELEDVPRWQVAVGWLFWLAAIAGSVLLAVVVGWSFSDWPMIAYIVVFVNLALWAMTSESRRRGPAGRGGGL